LCDLLTMTVGVALEMVMKSENSGSDLCFRELVGAKVVEEGHRALQYDNASIL
jgi:hypothetical protein